MSRVSAQCGDQIPALGTASSTCVGQRHSPLRPALLLARIALPRTPASDAVTRAAGSACQTTLQPKLTRQASFPENIRPAPATTCADGDTCAVAEMPACSTRGAQEVLPSITASAA